MLPSEKSQEQRHLVPAAWPAIQQSFVYRTHWRQMLQGEWLCSLHTKEPLGKGLLWRDLLCPNT